MLAHDQGAAGPIQAVGIGLRTPHYRTILEQRPAVPWFEVLIDNYFAKDSPPERHLAAVREHYPVTFHGVGLSLGSTDPLNRDYLTRLKELIDCYQPALVSEHLAWVSVGETYLHDLLPLPYVEEAIEHIAERIYVVQEFLGRQILIENVSSYLSYHASVMPEWEFLAEVARRVDCGILCDVNNIYVSAQNHGFDALDYLNAIPIERVQEMHLAGYEDQGTHLLDSHSQPVHAPVWELYRQALQRFGSVPTLIEWDNDIPEFATLQAEARTAQTMMDEVGRHAA